MRCWEKIVYKRAQSKSKDSFYQNEEKIIMESTFYFILVLSMIVATQGQTWAGTYKADSSCSTSSCCCLSGSVVLTSSSTNVYTVTSGASGVCGGATTFTGTAYTSGYTGWILVVGNNDTLTLSSDSNTITVTNPVYSACSGKGSKNSAIKQHSSIIMLFVITLIGGLINTSKN